VFYVPHNRGPEIGDLTVQPAGVVWSPSRAQSSRQVGPHVTKDPVSLQAVDAIRPKTAATATRKYYEHGARTVNWKATDPDGDRVTSRIEIRREGDSTWIPMAEDLSAEYFSWDVRGFPDGHYRARLTVDDAGDNPDGKQRVARRVSTAFRIDNTRPGLSEPRIREEDSAHTVEFTARDPGGQVAAVEAAVDAGDWQPLDPLDGVADSAEEQYRMRIEATADGSDDGRTVRVRVTDTAGNLGGDVWLLPRP